MKLSRDFHLHEFVPPEVYNAYGDRAVWFLDPRIITLAQFLRERFRTPVVINNWFSGGNYRYSGYRDPLSEVGAMFSQHKFGRAIDIKVQGIEPENIREDIRLHWPDYREAGLTTIEEGTQTWVHLDCRHTGIKELFVVPFT